MTLHRLVVRNVLRRPVRSSLLVAFVALSAFLGCFLRSVVTTLAGAVAQSSSRRLTVQSAVSLFAELPASYRDTIASIPGVASVNRWTWFGGVYKDPRHFFPRMAADLAVLLEQYPELVVKPDERAALLADRRGCLVGRGLAEQHGLKVGDTVPIIGTLYPMPDGAAWEFTVRAVYDVAPDAVFNEKAFFFSWELLDEVRRASLGAGASLVSFFWVTVREGFDPEAVMAQIDARYAAGPTRTLTQTEAAFRAARISALGNVTGLLGWIGAAVLFAVVLSAGNAMSMAVAERSREAGILRALGFPARRVGRLVVLESVYLTAAGGALGAAGAYGVVLALRRTLTDVLPTFRVEPATLLLAMAASVLVGVVAALVPAVRQASMRPLEVLRRDL